MFSLGSFIAEAGNPAPIDFSLLWVPHRVLMEAFTRCAQPRESLKQPRFSWTTVNISVRLWNLHSTQQQGGCTVEYNPSGSLPAITSTANSVWACRSPWIWMEGFKLQLSLKIRKNSNVPRKLSHMQSWVFDVVLVKNWISVFECIRSSEPDCCVSFSALI